MQEQYVGKTAMDQPQFPNQLILGNCCSRIRKRIPGSEGKSRLRDMDRRPISNSRSLECDSSWFAHFDSDRMIRHHRDVEKD